jgi:hypothetical protein
LLEKNIETKICFAVSTTTEGKLGFWFSEAWGVLLGLYRFRAGGLIP